MQNTHGILVSTPLTAISHMVLACELHAHTHHAHACINFWCNTHKCCIQIVNFCHTPSWHELLKYYPVCVCMFMTISPNACTFSPSHREEGCTFTNNTSSGARQKKTLWNIRSIRLTQKYYLKMCKKCKLNKLTQRRLPQKGALKGSVSQSV